MKSTRAVAVFAGAALAASLWTGAVSAQTESASAEDGAPASDAPAETAPAPNVPLGANLTPPLGALPPGPAIISGPAGSGQPGSSSVSMAPGTLSSGVAREGVNAVRAPEAEPAPAPEAAPAPEPVADTAVTETSEPVAADTAVATPDDLDADNLADALEGDLGLDPNTPDSDVDGVADGDEINIYGTSPTLFDTDGDGASDGEELFGIFTDPLVWNDFSTDASAESMAQEAAAAPAESVQPQNEVVSLGQETTEDLTAANGDAAALGTGNASAAPGSVTRDGVTVPGTSLLGPDGTYRVTESSPPEVSVSGNTSTPPVIVPAPVGGPAPAAVVETVETAAPVAADTAVASPEDADGDNYLDALELEVGLDPANPDFDGDGAADGDEVNIYLTDPFNWDTDGDGIGDGEELFGLLTNPLVWDTNGNGISDGEEIVV